MIDHFLIHSFLSTVLLSNSLNRLKYDKKYFKILFFISSIYVFLYLVKYGEKFSWLMNNILYLLIYFFIIGRYIYLVFKTLDKK